MYELVMKGEKTGYIDCPVKMGVYISESGKAWLIDSGGDKDAAKKALKTFEANGLSLQGIINTHLHADHIGGNKLAASRTGVPVYAEEIVRSVQKYPILEGSVIYGGYPMKGLRSKFVMAESWDDELLTPEKLPEGLEILDLSGHSISMIGLRTSDDMIFLADCVSSPEVIEKYHVCFQFDVKKALETLDYIDTLEAKLFIPSHTEPVEDIKPLSELNRKKIHEIMDLLLALCKEPKMADEIIKAVFDHYCLDMNLTQYALVGSTLRSYLSYLCDEGKMETVVEDNMIKFRAL